MALVFQSYALWPHMNVRQNIGYGLKLRLPRPAIAAKVDEICNAGPRGTGRSQRHRALRRATAARGARAGARRRSAYSLARRAALQSRCSHPPERPPRNPVAAARLGITAIHVTHDREEAMVMADRIVILNGRDRAGGPPEEVYNGPATPFVARFMGAENSIELPAAWRRSHRQFAAGPHNGPASFRGRMAAVHWRMPEGSVTAYFRSEAARARRAATQTAIAERDRAQRVCHARCHIPAVRGGIRSGWRTGDSSSMRRRRMTRSTVRIRLPAAALFLFPHESGQRRESGLEVTERPKGGAASD